MSSIIAGAFSWTLFSNNIDSACIWIVKATWYGALMFSVSSIASAAQQITVIQRLDLYSGGLQIIRQLLGEPRQSVDNNNQATGAGPRAPKFKLSQRFPWQISVMLLNGSLYLFTTGLCILAYWDFARSFGSPMGAVQVCRNPPFYCPLDATLLI